MKTYQDLLMVGEDNKERMDFVRVCISEHKNSDLYKNACVAYDYDAHRNRTISEFQKLLYTMSGSAVPDNYSSNWKMASNYFHRFVTQQTQYLLGNGVTWENDTTGDKLGKDFDTRLQEMGHDALVGGVAFGFFNMDHLEVFTVREFVPLYDEENGALMAGIRFWQIDGTKPLRATFYEPDGFTEYIWRSGEGSILKEKRAYVVFTRTSEVDGVEIYDFKNYPSFPIIPLWANSHHQSELVGLREQIDCYDLIKSGFANDVDDASLIYWTIQNAGGMDDVDLAKFVERLKTIHAATVDDVNSRAEAHTVDVPYESREALLARIEKDLYKDAMALDTENIASGATTATQIKAAYEPLNSKCDEFEYCVVDFLNGVMLVAGIEDNPTFTRSKLVNVQEEIQNIVTAATYLTSDYVTKKILTVLGDGDLTDEMLKDIDAEDMERMNGTTFPAPEETQEQEDEQNDG
jgi:SPP1 family phage portal protein